MGKIMKKVLLIGGTGGLGIQLSQFLKSEYECISIGSKDCDVTNDEAVQNLFSIHTDVDIIIYSHHCRGISRFLPPLDCKNSLAPLIVMDEVLIELLVFKSNLLELRYL